MKNRQTKAEIIEERVLYRVPLGRDGQQSAAIWKEDYDFLMKLGLSGNWHHCFANGYVRAPALQSPNRQVMVSRVLMDAGPGEIVVFQDRDTTNLRRENLRIKSSKLGRRRDREYISKKE